MSPGSSDSARGSSSYRWDPIGSSCTNLKDVQEAVVDDKLTASQAVAFVVHNSRKGIVHLCAEVANLMKAKKRLELLVQSLEKENAHLKQQTSCVRTDVSVTPSPPSPHSSESHHYLSRASKNRSLRCTRLRPASPALSTSTLTSHGEDILRVSPSPHSTKSSDSRLSGRTKNRSLRSTILKPASPIPSTSILNFPVEEICSLPLSLPTLHSPLSCDSLNSRGTKNISLRCTKMNTAFNSLTASTITSPSEAVFNSSSESGGLSSSGNLHRVRVQVHHNNQEQAGCESSQEHLMLNSEAVGGEPCPSESISIQCSIGESESSYLKDTIIKVEKEKAELESDNRRVQEEMDKLRLELKALKDTWKVNVQHAIELENNKNVKEKTLTKCNSQDKGASPSLPHLVEPDKAKTSVKSPEKFMGRFTFHLGDRVIMKGDLKGLIRYIGPLKHLNPSVMFAGVQLEAAVGHHDGVTRGHRYFQCPSNHGIFIPVQDIHTVITSKFSKRPRTALSSLTKISPYSIPQTIVPSKGRSNDMRSTRTPSRIKGHLIQNASKKF